MGIVRDALFDLITNAPDDKLEIILAVLNDELPESGFSAIKAAVAGEGRLALTRKGGASYNLITGEITTSDGRVL